MKQTESSQMGGEIFELSVLLINTGKRESQSNIITYRRIFLTLMLYFLIRYCSCRNEIPKYSAART